MERLLERSLTIVVALLLPVVLMLTSLEITAFDENFYASKHEEFNITEVVETDSAELGRISAKIIDYLRNRTDSLEMKAEIGGESVEVFGEREKLHMVDVKKLFMAGFYLRNVFLAFVILALFILYSMDGKKIEKPGRAVLASGFTVMIVTIALVAMILTDFQRYFIGFHKIFFNNDLWMLNPQTDVLIQMLPLEFFIDIMKRTMYAFLIQYALLMGIAFAAIRRFKGIRK
ncbi:MAG: TIGR01906 family membrane protein [Peptostreptococcaceae bacterium]|nr:TIGR01906 family membrane protein [Peptostreptococcaceae bacterium]